MKTENYAVNGEGSELHFAEDVLIGETTGEFFSPSWSECLAWNPKSAFARMTHTTRGYPDLSTNIESLESWIKDWILATRERNSSATAFVLAFPIDNQMTCGGAP
jgi:hypothetical protein